MKIRTGFGYDVHALAAGRELFIGGVRIEHPFGLDGHSDADVLIHAICDALLGAAGLRDIGVLFPDTAAEYKGIDSKILLTRTIQAIRDAGYEISNIDSTIIAQSPKLSPYIPRMRETLASVMQIPIDDISIKATTTEHLGFAGREEGMAAYASALICSRTHINTI
ncbi:MAG: 2-C-methyl-D-erythritol 2,4-cyclodiphosphate synthase [Tannerellaceae bacterium]|jgi:2-C-methyl-D-erythritol 2,4-cyclodiphosphate synthase|nr:2-C-methyl-D-erythritol 2,4-cyclodiphosphate synthase [Tannerellaceae bacterium]